MTICHILFITIQEDEINGSSGYPIQGQHQYQWLPGKLINLICITHAERMTYPYAQMKTSLNNEASNAKAHK